MKNIFNYYKITGITFLVFISFSLFSQVPQGFSYQAVARDAEQNPLVNTSMVVHFSIYSGTDELIWKEMHDVTTNDLGLFSLVICNNDLDKTDGSATLLTDIKWGDSPHSIQIEIEYAGSLIDMGKSPLMTVPYAHYANNSYGGWITNSDTLVSMSNVAIGTSEPGQSELAVKGFNINSTQPLFEVKRNDGVPVFAVYNDGVYVYVDETTKGVKGGFAVGGYNAALKSITNEYLRVSGDSVRIYINDETSKGIKGGFAIGGYNSTNKGAVREFFRVTDDSTRIYVDDDGTKMTKGGFAVGGYNASGKAVPYNFLNLTPENYFIGHESGSSITTGKYNAFLGYQAGMYNTTGNHNIFIGQSAGKENTSGGYNVALGSFAGNLNNGSYNVFIGFESGYNNISGADSRFSKYNTFVGYRSGKGNTTGWNNIAIGFQAGLKNRVATNQFFIGNGAGENLTAGYGNTYIGHLSGQKSQDNTENTFVGYQTGWDNLTGDYNTIVGYAAGLKLLGSGNVFLGRRAGFNETGDNKLYIENSSSVTPLIYGEFNNDLVVINDHLGVGVTPTLSPFAVAGLPPTSGGLYVRWSGNHFYYLSSSRATKEQIVPLKEDFHKILQAEPVSFIDKSTGEPHIGYIAEEFAEMGLENLVIYMDGKPASLSYELISLYNLEIIKEQKSLIEEKDKEIVDLKSRLERIEAYLGL